MFPERRMILDLTAYAFSDMPFKQTDVKKVLAGFRVQVYALRALVR